MPLFKKSKNGGAQREAELELQQSTLNMIGNDAAISSVKYDSSGPWYTPTSVNTGPFRSSTPRTSSSAGFSPASTLPSPGTSRASSPQSTLPRSPPPVFVTSANETPSFVKNPKTSASLSSKSPGRKKESSIPKSSKTELKQNDDLKTSSNPNFSIKPVASTPKTINSSTTSPSPSSEKGSSKSLNKESSPSPWATNGTATTTPIVRVITRDGEVSNNNSTKPNHEERKHIPIDQLTPNMRPRPGTKPKITRKVQTDPVDANFQLIKQEEDPEWVKKYKQFKKPIWIIFATFVFVLAIIIGFAASRDNAVNYDGAFASFLGERCSHFCRPGKYIDEIPETPLIVIALDGFRSDYLETYRKKLPNLRRLSECGVTADMRASFPATTSPNLWTIVSGYYPQFHGIVSDWMLDYNTGEEFNPRENPSGQSTTDAGWFHDPALWELARKQDKLTASHSWIGNNLGHVENEYQQMVDRSPTYSQRYDSSINYISRIETVLKWLSLSAKRRPTFTTVYFEDPGKTGRKYGTDSEEVGEVLDEIDKAIGHLFDELMRQEVVDCVNLMVVSTSGMVDTHCDDVYYLADDMTNLDDYIISPDYLGSMARITPKESAPDDMDTEKEVVEYLQCRVDDGQTYLRDYLPYRLHGTYGHHFEDAVILMDDGKTFAKKPTGYNRDNCRGANDGYDPFSDEMTGIFIGFGKDFRIGHSIKPFQNIELFNLMAHLIGVKPRTSAPPSDGTKGYLNNALKNPGPDPALPWGLYIPNSQMCQYPDQRRDALVGCACSAEALNEYPETAGTDLTEKDANLNLNQLGGSIERNAPFGLPGVKNDTNVNGEYFCILYQNNYITGYDHFLEIPIFVSFTVESTTGSVPFVENCSRYDQRLDPEKTPKCSDYNDIITEYLHIGRTFLYQPELAGNLNDEFNALITSNMVPQYMRFTEEIWKPLANRIRQWATDARHIHIVAGPAYDRDSDSKKDRYFDIGGSNSWVGDTPVPTHYFLVATTCQVQNNSVDETPLKDCMYNNIATMAYIFPHTNDIPPCFNFNDYLLNNRATLRDVETLTGLAFYTDWSMDSDTRMQMLRFKTQFSYNSMWVDF